MPRYKKHPEGGDIYENVSPSEPLADSVPLHQIEATVEEADLSQQIEATVEEAGQYRQEDCRMYEDISTTEPVADSGPQDQITPTSTVEEAGQYEKLNIEQGEEEYDDVKVYQRLKVL